MQPGHGRIQRLGQPGQRTPVRRGSPRDAHGPVAAQPGRPEREQRRGLAVEQRDPAVPAAVPRKAPRRPAAVRAGRPRRRDGGHAGASCPTSGSGEHADPPRVDLRHGGVQLRRQAPARTGGCTAAWSRCCGARRTWRSRAAPSPSGPDPSDTGAAWYGWRTEEGWPPTRFAAPPSTTSTTSPVRRGCGATPTGTNRPGPGSASPGAAGTPTAARPWAPSTAPPAHGGSWSSPHAPAGCGAPGRDRRCAASTTPPAAAPRHRPARASPGYGSAPRRTPPTVAASRPRWGSTAASPSAAPARSPAHPTGQAYNGPGQQDSTPARPSSTRKS